MENDFYVNAINSLIPDAKYHVRSGHELAKDNSIIEWFDERTQPTVSDIQTEMDRLKTEYDALQYQRDRQYPSIGDQLDMQYHDELNGTTTWKDAVAKVKADNPKPE
jgi:hypothetical protein